jgi:hypothetical protein
LSFYESLGTSAKTFSEKNLLTVNSGQNKFVKLVRVPVVLDGRDAARPELRRPAEGVGRPEADGIAERPGVVNTIFGDYSPIFGDKNWRFS